MRQCNPTPRSHPGLMHRPEERVIERIGPFTTGHRESTVLTSKHPNHRSATPILCRGEVWCAGVFSPTRAIVQHLPTSGSSVSSISSFKPTSMKARTFMAGMGERARALKREHGDEGDPKKPGYGECDGTSRLCCS